MLWQVLRALRGFLVLVAATLLFLALSVTLMGGSEPLAWAFYAATAACALLAGAAWGGAALADPLPRALRGRNARYWGGRRSDA